MSSTTGSSLEEMLDSLGRRGSQKLKDMPPVLPSRPTSRTRLPSNRRAALPEIVEAVMELSSSNRNANKEDSKGSRWKTVGVKTVKQVKQGESPYLTAASDESKSGEKLANTPPRSSFRESDWHENMEYFIKQIGDLEDVRREFLRGTLEIQKCFRCHLGRQNFHKLKSGSTTLQSYVRGEIARREYIALLGLKKQVADQKLDEAVLQIQSVIRGWLVRIHFSNCQDLEESNVSEEPEMVISEIQDVQTDMSVSSIELQKRLVIAEMTLVRKERENAVLREQLQQYEAKWFEYESKMKSMEEMWHNQMASLQMNLVAARKGISIAKSEKSSDTESPRFYDCEDAAHQNPGAGALVKFPDKGAIVAASGDKCGLDLATPLVNEFEQKKLKFDDEARAIIKIKSVNLPWVSPGDELQNLKHRFASWKTDFKGRLKEAKSKSQKPGHTDGDKIRRKWNDLVAQRSRFSLR